MLENSRKALINCQIVLLTSVSYLMIQKQQHLQYLMKKLYVGLINVSTQDNAKLLQQLKEQLIGANINKE